MSKTICEAVRKTENQCISDDDQRLASLEARINNKETARKKLNAGLRKMRAQRSAILKRRELTDAIV